MAVISVPVCIIKKTCPYLGRFYGFSYWYIQRYVESTCNLDDDNRVNLLPKFWMFQNLDMFPDDFGLYSTSRITKMWRHYKNNMIF